MERREFIRKTGKALGLAAVTGGVGLFFHNRQFSFYKPPAVKTVDFTVPKNNSLPQIVSAQYQDHVAALHSALDGIGGIKRFVKPGERVTIKPNVGWDRTPAQAANTNPVLVGEMIRLCFEAGAAEVIVSDMSCNDPRRCFLRSGIRESAEAAGAKVILPKDEDFITIDLEGEILTVWPMLKYFVETDRLINMPIVKQHSLSSCTIGMKNFYGILGGRRNQLHQSIDQSIVDLAAFCNPTLTVVDATRVLMRGGPQGGSINDVDRRDTVICATDQVAADALGATYLNLTPDKVGHIVLAEKSGLGQINYQNAGYRKIAS